MAIIQDDQKGVKMPCTQTSVLFNGTDFFFKIALYGMARIVTFAYIQSIKI